MRSNGRAAGIASAATSAVVAVRRVTRDTTCVGAAQRQFSAAAQTSTSAAGTAPSINSDRWRGATKASVEGAAVGASIVRAGGDAVDGGGDDDDGDGGGARTGPDLPGGPASSEHSSMRRTLACFGVCGALQLAPSPVEAFALRGKRLFVKRDDKCCLRSGVSGNKARKLASLDAAVPLARVIGSFGGSQSNAMAALAVLAHAHGSRFVYFTKPVPRWLRAAPSGNLARALSEGAELVELGVGILGALRGARHAASRDAGPPVTPDDGAWVPQGGAAGAEGVAASPRTRRGWRTAARRESSTSSS